MLMVPDVFGLAPSSRGRAVRPAGRTDGSADGRLHACRRSGRGSGSSSRKATRTTRSGWAAAGAAQSDVPLLANASIPVSPSIVIQTLGQNRFVVSDMPPRPDGRDRAAERDRRDTVVNDTGIYITNGKGATIVMAGPTITINNGALTVV